MLRRRKSVDIADGRKARSWQRACPDRAVATETEPACSMAHPYSVVPPAPQPLRSRDRAFLIAQDPAGRAAALQEKAEREPPSASFPRKGTAFGGVQIVP